MNVPRPRHHVADKQLPDRVLRKADGDAIVDGVDSRRRPCRSLRLFPFIGRSHLSSQRHGVTVRVDADLVRINFGTAFESCFDVCLDGRRADRGFQCHEISDALDTCEVSDRIVSGIPLVLPVHVSRQGHPPFGNLNLNASARNRQIPFQRIDGRLRNILVCPLPVTRQMHVEFCA